MTVNWDNIKAYEEESGRKWEHNFMKCTERGCNDLKVGYDYDSIMHYGVYLGEYPVLIPKKDKVSIGQRSRLSEKDIQGLNEHYCSGPGKIYNHCMKFRNISLQIIRDTQS